VTVDKFTGKVYIFVIQFIVLLLLFLLLPYGE